MEQGSLLSEALVNAQASLQNPTKDSANPFFNSRYADLAAVTECIRGVFAENGLVIIQELTTDIETVNDKLVYMVGVKTCVVHKSGERWVFGPFRLPVESGGADGDRGRQANLPQKLGSAATYARRYALMAVAGLAPEDDDGNSAGEARQPQKQATQTPVNERAKAGEVQSAARIEARRLFNALPKEKQQYVDIQMQKSVHKTLKDADEADMPRLQMLCRAAALTNEQHGKLTEMLQTNVLDLIQCGSGDIETINQLIARAAK